MKRLVVIIACVLIWWPGKVSAHVVVSDQVNQYKAIIHVSPGDDPAVGDEAVFFVDFGGGEVTTHKYTFAAYMESGGDDYLLSIETNGRSGIKIPYVFTRTGLHTLRLQATAPGSAPIEFTHAIHIARGGMETQSVGVAAWAEVGVVSSLVGAMGILIITNNRRALLTKFVADEPKRRGK